MNRFVLLIALVAGLLVPSVVMAQVETGQQAPEITLTDTKGQAHKLSDYKGKFVVLEWWNPECPFVKKHYESSNMQNLQKQYTDLGVTWITVNSSAPGNQGHLSGADAEKTLTEKKAAPSLIVLDPTGEVGKKFGAQTTPHMYVIDPEGKVVYQGAIDDKPSFKPEDLQGAKNYVKAALDAAMDGKPVVEGSTKAYGCSVKY